MDEPRISVVGEDDRTVAREQGVEIRVRQAVRVLARRLQLHQVDHVDDPHLELGEIATHQLDRGERLERGHVPGAGHDHVGLPPAVAARPFPDADAAAAVLDGGVHAQPLRSRVLARHDDIHVVPAAQAVIDHRQQTIGVRRQIDADHVGFLVDDEIDETRVLVREAVVVLSPDV